MAFTKNDPLINRKGRPKGALTKASGSLRQQILDFLEKHLDEFVRKDWPKLGSRDRMQFILGLLPYRLPRLQSQHVDLKIDPSQLSNEQLDEIIKNLTSDVEEKEILAN